jgi:hypothetical protein
MNTPPKSSLRATAIAPDLVEETEARAQICYRLSRERRDMLHRLALDRHTNLQAFSMRPWATSSPSCRWTRNPNRALSCCIASLRSLQLASSTAGR